MSERRIPVNPYEADGESPHINALAIYLRQNGIPAFSTLPHFATALSRLVGPPIQNIVYPSLDGDPYSVGGHAYRTWDIALELFQTVVRLYYPESIIPIGIYRQITAASLLHDIGKLSSKDEVVRNTEVFKDPDEKRRKVQQHVLVIPGLWGRFMTEVTKRSSPLFDISATNFPVDFEELKLAMYYGAIFHHLPIEGYPEIGPLLQSGSISSEDERIIRDQLDRNTNGSIKDALHRVIYGNELERAIAIALVILPPADVADAILSEKRPYQEQIFVRREHRFNSLFKALRRGYSLDLTNLFYESIYQLYDDPRILHKRALWHYGKLLDHRRRKPRIVPPRLTRNSLQILVNSLPPSYLDPEPNYMEVGKFM